MPNDESNRTESKHRAGAEGDEDGEGETATLLFKYHQTSQATARTTKMTTRLAKEPWTCSTDTVTNPVDCDSSTPVEAPCGDTDSAVLNFALDPHILRHSQTATKQN